MSAIGRGLKMALRRNYFLRPASSLLVRCCSSNILKSDITNMEFTKGNFTEFLMANNIERSNSIAFCCDVSPREMSYGELHDRIRRWGAFLRRQGLQQGDVVSVVSPNTVDYCSVLYGTIGVGCVFTGANPQYNAHEVAYHLKDCSARMVICYGPLEPLIKNALEINKENIPVYSIGPESPSKLPRVEDILSDTSLGFAEPAKLKGTETMLVFYSSGTTGKPKGSAISHNANIANVQMMLHPDFYASSHSTPKDQKSTLQLLPLYHIAGFLVTTSTALASGLKIHNITKFDPKLFVPFIKKRKVTSLPLVPTILNFALTQPDFDKRECGHVEHIMSGAAPVPSSSVQAVGEKFDDVFVQHGYGMTETLAVALDPKKTGLRLGYTGKLLPTVEAKVIDIETGEVLPANKDGELCMRSCSIMQGYLNNEEATRATVDEEGWVHSGDVAHYNEEGYIRIVDRTKELIKVNAFQVSPSEIEDVILQIPEVAEVSVIGVPDNRLGEAPRAYVVTSAPTTAEKVEDYVKANCSKTKHLIGGVRFVTQLPKNTTGKVMRKDLVKMAAEEDKI